MTAKTPPADAATWDGCDACADAASSRDMVLHVARWGLPELVRD